jgi:cobalt-zinc-cadmium resistance protein CzcA
VLSLAIFLSSLGILPLMGTEFIPTLEEGSIMIGVTMAPSISLEKATETVMKMERTIMGTGKWRDRLPYRTTRSRQSSPSRQLRGNPCGTETQAEQWPDKVVRRHWLAALHRDLSAYKGVKLNFTQPIQNAFDELLSGIKAQLAIKVFGEDLAVLKEKAFEIKEAIENVPGLVDLNAEQALGQPQVQVVADRPPAPATALRWDKSLKSWNWPWEERPSTIFISTRGGSISISLPGPLSG